MDDKPKILWIGHGGIPTGFGKVTDRVCRRLAGRGWDVNVLAVGYNGDPNPFPYKMYPAVNPTVGGHPNGLTRLPEIMKKVKPDIVVLHDDYWNVGLFADQMAIMNLYAPTVAYIAVDSGNVKTETATQLNNLKHAVCHTQFGADEIIKAGYRGSISVCPHGVDSIYVPQDKIESRSGILNKQDHNVNDAFIWGVVAMNQGRKRLDLTLQYFADWWNLAGKPSDAYLYLHTNLGGAWDLRQIGDHLGIRKQLLATTGGNLSMMENQMPTMYSAFDVLISTSECESFGLPHLEAMAVGVPSIAVDFGGLPSWATDNIFWVRPSIPHYLEEQINAKRWTVAGEPFVDAMRAMYDQPAVRDEYRRRGLEHAKKFSWDTLADHFDDVLHRVLNIKNAASKEDALAEFA